jgi:hypothetical protein
VAALLTRPVILHGCGACLACGSTDAIVTATTHQSAVGIR